MTTRKGFPVLVSKVGLTWMLVVTVWTRAAHSVPSDIGDLGTGHQDGLSPDQDKRAAFNAWAGKRDMLENFPDSDLRLKRPAFNAWAGKRDASQGGDEKRAAFNAWAGKRSVDEDTESLKRAAFNAWAGKRTFGPNSLGEKRAAFNAWAGKRDGSVDDGLSGDKRTMSFSSWAGKRSDDWGNDDGQADQGTGEISVPDKKAAFSSWAGKRALSHSQYNLQLLDWYLSKALAQVMQKRRFSAWAGKRNSIVRRRFGPWSG